MRRRRFPLGLPVAKNLGMSSNANGEERRDFLAVPPTPGVAYIGGVAGPGESVTSDNWDMGKYISPYISVKYFKPQ